MRACVMALGRDAVGNLVISVSSVKRVIIGAVDRCCSLTVGFELSMGPRPPWRHYSTDRMLSS